MSSRAWIVGDDRLWHSCNGITDSIDSDEEVDRNDQTIVEAISEIMDKCFRGINVGNICGHPIDALKKCKSGDKIP